MWPLEAENDLCPTASEEVGPQSGGCMVVNSANNLSELSSGFAPRNSGHLDFNTGKPRAENLEQPVLPSDLQTCEVIDLCCSKPAYDLIVLSLCNWL